MLVPDLCNFINLILNENCNLDDDIFNEDIKLLV